MDTRKINSLPTQYRALIRDILLHGEIVMNRRTVSRIYAGNSSNIAVDLTDSIMPQILLRKTYPVIAAAEAVWFLSGKQSIEWLNRYTFIWRPFSKNDIVKNAYGYRARHFHGRDQIAEAIKALKKDPTNRQVYVDLWDPKKDGLTNIGKELNVPCPIGFVLGIRKGYLDMTVFMRSSDVMVGLPYDIMTFAVVCTAMAISIGVFPGRLTMSLAQPHIYTLHVIEAKKILTIQAKQTGIKMPLWGVNIAKGFPDDYVNFFMQQEYLNQGVRIPLNAIK